MPAPKRKRTQTELGLGWRHRQAADHLRDNHHDGKLCICGRPMFKDRTKNYDYDPQSTNSTSGVLQADHSGMSRAEAIRRGLPIPLPDRLLHGECNRMRGDGKNDHLFTWGDATRAPAPDQPALYMPWPQTLNVSQQTT